MFEVKQFEGSAVSPRDDAILYDAIIRRSGVFRGLEITHLGANLLLVGEGRGIIKGRVWSHPEETISCTLADVAGMKGRMYLHLDLSNTDEPLSLRTEVGSSLGELLQEEECNYTNGVYEVELCTYDVSDTAISNLNVTFIKLESIFPVAETLEEAAATTDVNVLAAAKALGELYEEHTELNKNLMANDGLKFQFATDGEGNYGFLGADGSLVPFKRGTDDVFIFQNTSDEYTTAAYKGENIPMLRSDNTGFTVKTAGTYTCYAYYRGNNATYGIKPTVRINGENVSNSNIVNSLSSDGYQKIMTSFMFSEGDFVDVIANSTSSAPGLRCYLVLALV